MNKRPVPLVFSLLLVSGWGLAENEPPHTARFPAPPQQDAPWSLPEKAPDPKGKLKAAVDAMFQLGLADPRGCDYRHVTVRECGKTHAARGWVLPAAQGDPTRYAIGWNGLVYPVESIGKQADLAADLGILREKGAFEEPPFSNYQDETLDKLVTEFAASPRMMRAWAAPYLLLRVGADITVYGSDVEQANPVDPFAEKPRAPELKDYPASLYLDSESDQLVEFARLIRGDGVAAVLDKNDRLAAMRLQTFDRVWAEVERRMPHEEGEREIDPFRDNQKPLRPKLNSSWRSLLADAQRRLSPSKVAADSEISREIATWDQLENWNRESPPATFEKVVAAGPSAISPLLDCLEHDQRWTRILEDNGSISGDRHVDLHFVRVRELALRALNRILRFEVVEDNSYDSIPADDSWYADAAARMNMFSVKYGNACGGELWFRILADEKADIDDQFRAAKSIVRPISGIGYDLDYDPFVSKALDRVFDPVRSMEGEQLRTRRNPTVMELLQKVWRKSRTKTDKAIAEGAAQTKSPPGCGAQFSTIFDQSHDLVLMMEEWQLGNQDVLKEHYDWLVAALARMRNGVDLDFLVFQMCEEMLVLRHAVNDQTAMRDYEKLFRSSFQSNQIPFRLMNEFPEVPGMDELLKEALFGDKAPLNLINKPWSAKECERQQLIEGGLPSPLLVLPSFRRALIEALQTQTRQGTRVVTKEGCSVKYDADAAEPDTDTPAEPTLPGTGEEMRLCDIVADLITPKGGPQVWVSPRFRLEDPLAERDRAIAEWIRVLSKPAP